MSEASDDASYDAPEEMVPVVQYYNIASAPEETVVIVSSDSDAAVPGKTNA